MGLSGRCSKYAQGNNEEICKSISVTYCMTIGNIDSCSKLESIVTQSETRVWRLAVSARRID